MYAILDEARRRGTMVRELTLPGTLARGGASVQIAGWRASTADSGGVPRKSYTGSPPLRISGGVSSLLLLPGGMSGTLRQEWATADAANASAAFESKVLVLGQGAKLASAPELLSRVLPKIAILDGQSSGPAQTSGRQSTEWLHAAGVQVFRPDLDGAVTVQMKGDRFLVHCDARPCEP